MKPSTNLHFQYLGAPCQVQSTQEHFGAPTPLSLNIRCQSSAWVTHHMGEHFKLTGQHWPTDSMRGSLL